MDNSISKRRSYILILLLLFSFLSFFSVIDASAQKKGEKSGKYINLKKDARTNGYKITMQNGQIFFEAMKIMDKITKNLIEGEHQILYRCSENGPVVSVPVLLTNGNSNKVLIQCEAIIDTMAFVTAD